jgi:hypothetical protein
MKPPQGYLRGDGLYDPRSTPAPVSSLSPLSPSPLRRHESGPRSHSNAPAHSDTLLAPTAEMPVGAAEARFDGAAFNANAAIPKAWSSQFRPPRRRSTLDLSVCQVGEPDRPLDLGRRSPHEKRRPVIVK